MEKFCPITEKRVDENIARLNAIATFLLIGVYALTGSIYIIGFLLIDFIIRGFIDGKFSLLSFINRGIARSLHLEKRVINAGPKIFAAQVGTTLSATIAIATLTGFTHFALGIAIILAFFSFLEGAFGICVACKMYPFFRRAV